MPANTGNSAATHFGRQMKKERLAHGWSLREFAARTGIDYTTVSRVENGKRPPTEKVAVACDTVFPGRRGWFLEYYEESRHWGEIPPGFRNWSELEEKAGSLRDWYPGIVTGLLQTEGYARALLSTYPGVDDETVRTRLANRMERQRRVLMREDPPTARFVVDEMALYRRVGSPGIMAAEMSHLSAVADDSAWCEHVKGGFVYTGESVTSLLALFDTLRGECYRVSESAALFERMAGVWTHGVRAAIQTPTAASVPK